VALDAIVLGSVLGSVTIIIIWSSTVRKNVKRGTRAMFAGSQGKSGSITPGEIVFTKKV